jgi:hypothetical protein
VSAGNRSKNIPVSREFFSGMIRHFRRNIHGTDRERSQTVAAAML